jgi:hypothetical protein
VCSELQWTCGKKANARRSNFKNINDYGADHGSRGFEFRSGHGCLLFVLCVRFPACVPVETLRRSDHPSKEFYRLPTSSN